MRRIVAWLFIVATLLLPQVAQAQAEAIALRAEPLYDGTSKYGEWLPVVVELANSGPDQRGRVEAQIGGTGQASFGQPVELPAGARKRVTLYILPNNFSRKLQVSFTPDEADEPLATVEATLRPVPNVRFMTATVAAGGNGLESIADVNFRGEQQRDKALTVPLTLDTLPERPEALRTLDMIVLSGVDTSALTPRQKTTLEQYVNRGGLLVLGGGPEAGRVLAGLPATLLPVTLAGEAVLETLPALTAFGGGEAVRVNGPFPAARGEPVPEASVRLAEGAQPLVVERAVGRGAVVWLALDPALSPFDAWAGAEAFWQSVVGTRAFYPRDMPSDVAPRQMFNDNLFYALQNLPSLDLPSLRLLVPLLGVYIFVVGPLNYFILRRRRRLELAWLTIPALTLLFSLGTYGLGFGLRGSDIIVNQITLAQGIPGSEGATLHTLVGLFSPARRSYTFAIPGEPLLAPLQNNGDPFGQPSAPSPSTARLLQGEPAVVENLTVSQWSMQGVAAESLAIEGFGFDAELATGDGALTGRIRNRTAQPWEDVVVVLGNNFSRVGDIAPGASAEVRMAARDGGGVMNGDLTWRIFEEQLNGPAPDRDAQIRQQILGSLFGSATPLMTNQGPILLAWTRQAPSEVELLNQQEPTRVATTLFYAALPLRFGTGEVSVPRGMMSARVTSTDGGTCYGPTVASLGPDFREAEIQFTLPNDLRVIDPSLLSLYLTTEGGEFTAPQAALFDHEQETWVDLARVALGRNKVEDPDAFISDEGLVRLRLQRDGGFNTGGCLFLDAALEGELP